MWVFFPPSETFCTFVFLVALTESDPIPDSLHLFRLIPHSDVTQELLWTSGEVKLEGESKHIVNTSEEIQTIFHLRLNLQEKNTHVSSHLLCFRAQQPP